MGGVPAGAGSLVGQRLGKYQLLALLALGGTAEIYLARIEGTSGFEKYVVVKCLHDHLADDQEFVHMFLDEARLGATLDHSNIVQTLELGEQNGRYYMAMEFLAGMSLALVARKAVDRVSGGRVPVHLTLGLAAQACAGLHYAHERRSGGKPLNIVHRDISPQNLVVTFEGVVKLVDFGIAKAEHRETHTRSGTIKGKFAYMSPEQCLAKDVDRRTDVFALGTIVHELVTGRRLFKRGSTYDTYQAILEGKVPLPSAVNHELDPGLDPVIMKALAYKREDRYPTAEAFGEALIGYLHHRGKHSGPGEVSRFFDQYYQEEIDEHGARMRGLLEGREQATGLLTWDAEQASDVATRMPDDEPDSAVVSLDTGDVELEESVSRAGAAAARALSDVGRESPTQPKQGRVAAETVDLGAADLHEVGLEDEIGEEEAGDADEDEALDTVDEPVDRTRIEENPLARVLELERQQEAAKQAKAPAAKGAPGPPAAAPAAAAAVAKPASGAPAGGAALFGAKPAAAAGRAALGPLPSIPAGPLGARGAAAAPSSSSSSSSGAGASGAARAATVPAKPSARAGGPAPLAPAAQAPQVEVPVVAKAGPNDRTDPEVAVLGPAHAPQGKRRNAPGTQPPPSMSPSHGAPLPREAPRPRETARSKSPTAPMLPSTPMPGAAAGAIPASPAADVPTQLEPIISPAADVPTQLEAIAAPGRPAARGFAAAPDARTMFDAPAPAPAARAGFALAPDQVSTMIHEAPEAAAAARDGSGPVLTPPSVSSFVPPPSANPAGAVAHVELPLPAHLIGLPPIQEVFNTSELAAIERDRNRKVPPWLLVVAFVGAVAIALGLTIAIARALR